MIVENALIQALGWTLLQSLWQGFLLMCILGGLLQLFRKHHPTGAICAFLVFCPDPGQLDEPYFCPKLFGGHYHQFYRLGSTAPGRACAKPSGYFRTGNTSTRRGNRQGSGFA